MSTTEQRPRTVKRARAQQSELCLLPGDEKIAFQWVFIDKDLALQLLHSNTRNRPMNRERVAKYARDMERGDWWVGSVLNIGEDGIFQNGQHRLQSIVASDTAHWFGIVRGLPPRAQDTMDQGMARQFGGQLRIRGVKRANTVAAITRSVWFYREAGYLTGQNVSRQPSISELSDLYAEHPGIDECATRGQLWIGLTGGWVGAFRYLASLESPDEVTDFLGKIKEGGLPVGDPIRALQDRLSVDMAKRDRPHTTSRAAYLVKTWNSWIKGEEVKLLRWAPYGPKAETMPLIHGCSITPRA